ncbi:ATP-binding protein [Anaerosinus massiliensis]|uniref:ATP-binding protein n=1 Tax=Massilibacillus massiliensis TaxID=1806837 RepID=UPI000AFF47CA|nr:4Fe-4S binding protein [Massilibacillus massiliensis]
MLRKIIKIDTEKCNGCGLCAKACHESAIAMINGKAVLIRDDYCDGLGDCLPVCPTNAIQFEEREALPYDEIAVKENMKNKTTPQIHLQSSVQSELKQWPVQIKLVQPNAKFFDQSDLLIAADCTAYAYANFHNDFIKGKTILIGCPKLDMVDYTEKLTEIFKQNVIRSITVTRMIVPCCGGIEFAVKKAIENSNKNLPCKIVTIDTDGTILNKNSN